MTETVTEQRYSDGDGEETTAAPWSRLPFDRTPALRRGAVHLWLGDLDSGGSGEGGAGERGSDLARLEGILSEDELDRARRYRSRRHRASFTFGRAMLRSVLSLYAGAEPQALRFRFGARGKPTLIGGDDLEFSLSRSGALVLLGVTRGREIGVDVEQVAVWPEGEAERVARTAISESAAQAIHSTAAEATAEAFCRLWVAREALAKASGEGLSAEAAPVEALLESEPTGAWLAFGGWRLLEVAPSPSYRGAVTVVGEPAGLLRLRWEAASPVLS